MVEDVGNYQTKLNHSDYMGKGVSNYQTKCSHSDYMGTWTKVWVIIKPNAAIVTTWVKGKGVSNNQTKRSHSHGYMVEAVKNYLSQMKS